jgi:hypothetical protein
LGGYFVETLADMQLSCEKVRVLEQEPARVRVVPERHVWEVASSLTWRDADVNIVSEMPPDPAWDVSWRIWYHVLDASPAISLVGYD